MLVDVVVVGVDHVDDVADVVGGGVGGDEDGGVDVGRGVVGRNAVTTQ